MNTLTIDIGNSKTKVDSWSDDGLISREAEGEVSIDEIVKLVEDLKIKGIIVSSVRRLTPMLSQQLRNLPECKIVDFDKYEISRYSDRINYNGNIGADRIAAFIGAEALMSKTSKLVIDAGTAITFDLIDAEGNFLGGNISLGLHQRMKALAQSTGLLPLVDNCNSCADFGTNTVEAIYTGAINGIKGEVSYTCKLAKEKYNTEKVVITGGEGDTIWSTIFHDWEDIIKDPYLVGRGLNYHLRKFYFPQDFLITKFHESLC